MVSWLCLAWLAVNSNSNLLTCILVDSYQPTMSMLGDRFILLYANEFGGDWNVCRLGLGGGGGGEVLHSSLEEQL